MQNAALFRLLSGGAAWFCMHSLSAASPITPSPTSSLRVSEELREAILSGEFGPGERLRTASLAKRFGSSRTPVREALVQLEGEGLVDIEPRRGALVRSFASSDLIDLYEIRALLEPAAAARAALRVREDQLDRLRALVALSDARGGREAARDRRSDRLERGVPRDRDRGRRAARGCRPRCARRRASRAASARRSGATRRTARSRRPAIASSSRRSASARPSAPRRSCGCTSCAPRTRSSR